MNRNLDCKGKQIISKQLKSQKNHWFYVKKNIINAQICQITSNLALYSEI